MTVRLLTFNEIFFRLNPICRFRLIECRIVRMKKKRKKKWKRKRKREKRQSKKIIVDFWNPL